MFFGRVARGWWTGWDSPDAELVVTSWHCKFKGTSDHASNQAVKLWNKPLRSLSPGLHEHGTHVDPIEMSFFRGLTPNRVSCVKKEACIWPRTILSRMLLQGKS